MNKNNRWSIFSSVGNSFLRMARISLTVRLPSHCFHTTDPILSRVAVNVSPFLMRLQKDFPKLLSNFGTVILTKPSSEVSQGNSPLAGLNRSISSRVGKRGSCLFLFLSKYFPQWDIRQEKRQEHEQQYCGKNWCFWEDMQVNTCDNHKGDKNAGKRFSCN